MKKLQLFLTFLFGLSAFALHADITIPVIDDDRNHDPKDDRRRTRPMMQWCTIDTDARTVTTTLSVPVITYYIVDTDTDAVVIASDCAEEFASGVATLPEGVYTLSLLTADSAFSGPLTIE